MRAVLATFVRLFYRVSIAGLENVPRAGGALLVANHVSFIDVILLAYAARRNVRYLIFEDLYSHPLVWPVAKAFRAIPVRADLPPREMLRALHAAGRAIEAGELLCVFAEGEITRLGTLLPFRKGFERVMRAVAAERHRSGTYDAAPIIPVNLDVWGSIFSFAHGRFFWKLPRSLRLPVSVSFGAPMPGNSTSEQLRQAVAELQSDAWRLRKPHMRMLHRSWLRTARRHPFRFAVADARAGAISYASALMKALYLARRLKPLWTGAEYVGILLPPTIAAALVNLAATLMGKVPVNLNYSASAEAIASACAQCSITTIVTSRAFLERMPFTAPPGVKVILLEDAAASPQTSERLLAFFTALLPARAIERVFGRIEHGSIDSTAAMIFSSGSTGEPKGVVLSHYNIQSNIEQMLQLFRFTSADRMIGVLPFFHSFGFTVTLWLPPVAGIGALYHPNPLDAQVIGELARKHRGSIIVATPTFLQTYLRRCEPDDFRSLWLPIVGAEKLTDRLASAWQERFGSRPLEGYGATECSPVVAVNTFDYVANGIVQRGSKPGSIGRPLPGIAVHIVDPESGAALPLGATGMLLVRGPNVMRGYLGRPDLTAQVLHDGWYTTGDLASLDDEGFLHIADRLSRFSKIAGEMVPHLRIEEALHDAIGTSERHFVVTAAADDRRGERLVVLHDLEASPLETALSGLVSLPPLWRPKRDDIIRVDQLPLLGSGKIDLFHAKRIAREALAQRT